MNDDRFILARIKNCETYLAFIFLSPCKHDLKLIEIDPFSPLIPLIASTYKSEYRV